MSLQEGVKTENDHINLKVAGQDGSVVQFKIKRHTPLSKLMKAYCERQVRAALPRARPCVCVRCVCPVCARGCVQCVCMSCVRGGACSVCITCACPACVRALRVCVRVVFLGGSYPVPLSVTAISSSSCAPVTPPALPPESGGSS